MSSMTSTSQDGPELLNKRSIGGILVHLLAVMTGGLGAGLVYLASSHEYTQANARNALNWHLSVLALSVFSFLIFFLGADELTIGGETMAWSIVPPPLDTIVGLIGIILMLVTMIAWLLTWIFTVIATGKAIFGTPWEYPLSRDFVERYS